MNADLFAQFLRDALSGTVGSGRMRDGLIVESVAHSDEW
jgi:hypothetical protein